MRRFAKYLTVASAITVFSLAFALGGCAPQKQPEEVVYPEPEYGIDETLMADNDPNADIFAISNVTKKENSPLEGKTIYWLGSSVTYGSASYAQSMADYLAAMTGCISKKEAVSGTTLYDDGGTGDSGAKSYTRRMLNSSVFDKDEQIDAFICQISTNDARNDRLNKWGEMRTDNEIVVEAFDRSTTLGGVEFIIAYVRETWNCPVYFYSGGYFGDEGTRKSTNPTGTNYGKLVDEVKKIADKWYDMGYEVGVIDLFNDEEFNAKASDDYYKWCMSDAIHPKRAGYYQWWTPYFENYLTIKLTMN